MNKYQCQISNAQYQIEKSNQGQTGFIAIASVLVVAAVVLAIGINVSLLAIGEGQAGLAQYKGEDTLNLVEGCMEDALLKARNSSSYNGGPIFQSGNDCNASISKVANTWTMTVSPGAVVIFDDAVGQDVPLNGQFPTGVINWGSGSWYLSHAGYGLFATKSMGFLNATIFSASFTFVTPSRLISIQAYNGGTVSSTITLNCTGQTPVSQVVAVGQLVTITPNWLGACSVVTVGSTNSWDTNFDNLVYQEGSTTAIYSRSIQTIFTRNGYGITLTSWKEI